MNLFGNLFHHESINPISGCMGTQEYSVLVYVSCPKALLYLDNHFRISAVVADWLG